MASVSSEKEQQDRAQLEAILRLGGDFWLALGRPPQSPSVYIEPFGVCLGHLSEHAGLISFSLNPALTHFAGADMRVLGSGIFLASYAHMLGYLHACLLVEFKHAWDPGAAWHRPSPSHQAAIRAARVRYLGGPVDSLWRQPTP